MVVEGVVGTPQRIRFEEASVLSRGSRRSEIIVEGRTVDLLVKLLQSYMQILHQGGKRTYSRPRQKLDLVTIMTKKGFRRKFDKNFEKCF